MKTKPKFPVAEINVKSGAAARALAKKKADSLSTLV